MLDEVCEGVMVEVENQEIKDFVYANPHTSQGGRPGACSGAGHTRAPRTVQ